VKKRVLAVTLIVLVAALGVWIVELSIPKRQYFLQRPGDLESAPLIASASAGFVDETRQLKSSTGLTVDFRVRRPALPESAQIPVLLVVGGERTGKDAVELGGSPEDVAFVAIDYPYDGSRDIDGFWQMTAAIPPIQRAFLDTPPALSLVIDWLEQQPWVDRHGIEIVGASLGVPFAAVCGALDDRLARVWLLHGGADNLEWLMHAGREDIPNPFLRRVVARTLLLAIYGNSFDTARWIREITPRPLVIVAAKNDDYVPPAAVQPFVTAAADIDTIEMIWTEGLHIRPERPEELRQLLDIVLGRIPRPR